MRMRFSFIHGIRIFDYSEHSPLSELSWSFETLVSCCWVEPIILFNSHENETFMASIKWGKHIKQNFRVWSRTREVRCTQNIMKICEIGVIRGFRLFSFFFIISLQNKRKELDCVLDKAKHKRNIIKKVIHTNQWKFKYTDCDGYWILDTTNQTSHALFWK